MGSYSRGNKSKFLSESEILEIRKTNRNSRSCIPCGLLFDTQEQLILVLTILVRLAEHD